MVSEQDDKLHVFHVVLVVVLLTSQAGGKKARLQRERLFIAAWPKGIFWCRASLISILYPCKTVTLCNLGVAVIESDRFVGGCSDDLLPCTITLKISRHSSRCAFSFHRRWISFSWSVLCLSMWPHTHTHILTRSNWKISALESVKNQQFNLVRFDLNCN